MTEREDFYVGYQDRAPRRLARFIATRAGLILTAATGLAAVLAAIQRPPSQSVFEFGVVREFQGRIRERPYPMLVVGPSAADPAYLLVREGKHGAGEMVEGLDGQLVRITGSLVYRGTHTMIEIHSPPVTLDAVKTSWETGTDGGAAELRGEIVDGKCHLGAMNPGSGSTHRACAIRCLLGGIPPLLAVRGPGEGVTEMILAAPNGGPIDPADLIAVGAPIRIRGQLRASGGWVILEADLKSIVRTGR